MSASRLSPLERYLLGRVGRAVARYAMIGEGDCVLAAVSGGADSLLMLKLLVARARRIRAPYTVRAAHVRVSAACSGAALPQPFLEAVDSLGVPLVIREVVDDTPPRGSRCFRCSWLRRKTLFEIAHGMGVSKIALGHHADDLAETALMNLFWHGQFSSMAPVVSMMGGTFTLVRPLIYVRKDSIDRWRRAQTGSFFSSSCREEGTRAFVRSVLEQVYRRNRAARKNLLRCLLDEGGQQRKTE